MVPQTGVRKGSVKSYLAVIIVTVFATYNVCLYRISTRMSIKPQTMDGNREMQGDRHFLNVGQSYHSMDCWQRWWNSNITIDEFPLLSKNTPCCRVEINMASLRQIQDWNGRNISTVSYKPHKTSVFINMRDAPSCLRINKTESGIAQIMNEQNFAGVRCNPRSTQFSADSNHHTALASFPGSGNTWTRHLMEQLSGITAGSVYNDTTLNHIFNGSGQTENVVVIKTHKPYRKTQQMDFDNAILLIRTPVESILSWFNYLKLRSHVDIVDKSLFHIPGKSHWKHHVDSNVQRWKFFYDRWLREYTGRMMILSYGKLQQDFFNEVFRVGHFSNISMTYKTLWCVYKTQEGMFHRNHSDAVNSNTVYTEDMLQQIEAVRTDVAERIKKMFGIEGII